MSNGAAQSPAQATGAGYDEKVYMEKLKDLQKYIEPLSRMINKVWNSKTNCTVFNYLKSLKLYCSK